MNPLLLVAAGAIVGLLFQDRKATDDKSSKDGDHSGVGSGDCEPSPSAEQNNRVRLTPKIKEKYNEVSTYRQGICPDGGNRVSDDLHLEPVPPIEEPSIGPVNIDQKLDQEILKKES